MEIYREVKTVLEQLFEQSAGGAQSEVAGVTTSPNKSPNATSDVPNLSPADANHQVNYSITKIIQFVTVNKIIIF